MIRDEKALISIAFLGRADFEAYPANSRMKKPANALTWQAFYLVAGERNQLYLLLRAAA
jgi:hypothetical protein